MDPDRVADRVRSSNFPSWRPASTWNPPHIVRASGSTFWDDRGKAYLDLASQLVATNLGHNNPAVSEAIARQARSLAYVAPGFATGPRAELSEALDRVLPEGLRRYFFSTSGTEANEAALKIARLSTGRAGILARTRSYHGSTAAALSVSGEFRREAAGPLQAVPGTTFVPDCYCYRCPLQLEYPSCGVACADEVAERIDESGEIAALIVEPVVGTNGVLVPVPEYLPKVREITRSRGVLLIADEVMTGWGRTGAWFAVDHWGVRPDLLTTAKGITGAHFPLGLTAATEPLYDRYREHLFPHGHTYEGHPIGMAAAGAALSEYHRLDLIEKSRKDGAYLLTRLREIAPRHPSVGEVRGLGLFAAVELVRDRKTRAPCNRPEDQRSGRDTVAAAVARALWAEGVYVIAWVSHLVLAPPLIIERSELDHALEALDRCLKVADEWVRDHPTSS